MCLQGMYKYSKNAVNRFSLCMYNRNIENGRQGIDWICFKIKLCSMYSDVLLNVDILEDI